MPSPHEPARALRGFTLVEVLIALAVAGILASLAAGAYDRYRERALVGQAVVEIGGMAAAIKLRELDTRDLPDSLADVGFGGKLDPWGRPYQYLNLASLKGNGMARKDKKLAPLNTDFDLYSMGKDGKSIAPLNASVSRDDIVRARDGRFIGLAADFDP